MTTDTIHSLAYTGDDLEAFVARVLNDLDDHKDKSLIIEWGPRALDAATADRLEPVRKYYATLRRSLVVVAPSSELDEETEVGLNVVPTTQEAHDLIQMEDIERDLGL